MIFPIGDDQVRGGYKPIFSYAFIGINIIVFLMQYSIPGNLICEYGAIPYKVVHEGDYLTLITSMFMHGGWMHLIGNMMFLWVFADNIEATVGNLNFVIFYFLGGLAASATHIYFGGGAGAITENCCMICNQGIQCQGENVRACAGGIPSVGASGAIAAVMGAYLVMFPHSKIKMFVVYFFSSFKVPAILFLLFWIGQQLLSGFAALGPQTAETSGVAWWAHIGGFVFGVIAGFFAGGKAKLNQGGNDNIASPPYSLPKRDDFI